MIRERIKADRLKFRKEGDAEKVATLTTILGDLESEQKRGGAVDDPFVISYIKKAIANAKENFKHSGGDEKFIKEVEILEQYLPKQFTTEELSVIVDTLIKKQLETPNMGFIMSELKTMYGGLYDGSIAAKLVKQKLL